MREVKITGVTVSTFFDDGVSSDIEINCGTLESVGDYVSIEEDGKQVFIRADEWVLIREQVQLMFDKMQGQKKNSHESNN